MTKEQIAAAIEELSAIPYFPQAAGAKITIGAHIEKFVGDAKKLRWLVDAAVNVMPEWKGIPELRGLYCTRYKPADGVEGWCSLPGYTPEDSEVAFTREIYTAPYKELADGLPFEADLEKLAEMKRLK